MHSSSPTEITLIIYIQRFWSLLTDLHPSYFLWKFLGFLRGCGRPPAAWETASHMADIYRSWSESCLGFLVSFGILPFLGLVSNPVYGYVTFYYFLQVFQLNGKFLSKKNKQQNGKGKLWWRDFQRVPLLRRISNHTLSRAAAQPSQATCMEGDLSMDKSRKWRMYPPKIKTFP